MLATSAVSKALSTSFLSLWRTLQPGGMGYITTGAVRSPDLEPTVAVEPYERCDANTNRETSRGDEGACSLVVVTGADGFFVSRCLAPPARYPTLLCHRRSGRRLPSQCL